MVQVMHMPTADRAHTLCGRVWQTYLLTEGSAWPICPTCWDVMMSGHDVDEPITVALTDLPEQPIQRVHAQRLDQPKAVEPPPTP